MEYKQAVAYGHADFALAAAADLAAKDIAEFCGVVNKPFPAEGVSVATVTYKPVYGSFWRWILNKPASFEVTATFTINGHEQEKQRQETPH